MARKARKKREEIVTLTMADLRAAEYNPRAIEQHAARALDASMANFGDIAGFVFNKRTGNMVTGHQRLRALRKKYGLRLVLRVDSPEDARISTPDGDWSLRLVDWSLETEMAANVAANSPSLHGKFTEDLADILDTVRESDDAIYESLLLSDLETQAQDVEQKSTQVSTKPVVQEYVYRIVVTCVSEEEQALFYEKWKSEGLSCKLLTL